MKELIVASGRLARNIITPRARRRPAVITRPSTTREESEIALLAKVLTLTPDSLTLVVADDRAVTSVHAMFVDDPNTMRAEIKIGLQRRVRELLQ